MLWIGIKKRQAYCLSFSCLSCGLCFLILHSALKPARPSGTQAFDSSYGRYKGCGQDTGFQNPFLIVCLHADTPLSSFAVIVTHAGNTCPVPVSDAGKGFPSTRTLNRMSCPSSCRLKGLGRQLIGRAGPDAVFRPVYPALETPDNVHYIACLKLILCLFRIFPP